jgi:hypothetical protein
MDAMPHLLSNIRGQCVRDNCPVVPGAICRGCVPRKILYMWVPELCRLAKRITYLAIIQRQPDQRLTAKDHPHMPELALGPVPTNWHLVPPPFIPISCDAQSLGCPWDAS